MDSGRRKCVRALLCVESPDAEQYTAAALGDKGAFMACKAKGLCVMSSSVTVSDQVGKLSKFDNAG